MLKHCIILGNIFSHDKFLEEQHQDQVQCCLTSTETIRTIRDWEPRTATSAFTKILSSECCFNSSFYLLCLHAWLHLMTRTFTSVWVSVYLGQTAMNAKAKKAGHFQCMAHSDHTEDQSCTPIKPRIGVWLSLQGGKV